MNDSPRRCCPIESSQLAVGFRQEPDKHGVGRDNPCPPKGTRGNPTPIAQKADALDKTETQ